MTEPRVITRAAVAAELGRSLGWLDRHIRVLREKHGFPHPLPGIGRYDRAAIHAWMDRQAGGAVETPPAADDWGAILDARAKQMAAGRRAA